METIDLLNKRVSLRSYLKRPITDEHMEIILNGAMRAPTAGNLMLYSIIVVKDQKKKDILAESCDHQPFIAKAPAVLIFLADMRKLYDYFEYCDVKEYCEKHNLKYNTPDKSKLFLAAGDAFIAAQNAVVAAEAVGVGTCYIGDIIENYQIHRDILNLPEWTIPVAMLTMGYYPENFSIEPNPRYDKEFVVFEEEYKRLSKEQFETMYSDKKVLENNNLDAKNFGQIVYARKFGAEFANEMEESINLYIKDWLDK